MRGSAASLLVALALGAGSAHAQGIESSLAQQAAAGVSVQRSPDDVLRSMYCDAILQPPWQAEAFERKLEWDRPETVRDHLEGMLSRGDYRGFEKEMLARRLPMSEPVRETIYASLAADYGVAEPHEGAFSRRDAAVDACVEMERFGIDPRAVLARTDELKEYFAGHLWGSKLKDYDTGKLVRFVLDGVRATVIYRERVKDVYEEADRIDAMTPKEWLAYKEETGLDIRRASHQGMWAGYMRQDASSVDHYLLKTIDRAALDGIPGEGMLVLMGEAPVVRDLASTLTITRDGFQMWALGDNLSRGPFLDNAYGFGKR